MRRALAVVLLVLPFLFPADLQAQGFDFYARGPYRPAVPRPDSLLGYPVGQRQTMYGQQQQVLERMVAAAPDRARTEVIGKTAEGRVMRLLIISAPENLARLDQIRADLSALADPRRTSPAQAQAIADRTPAVVLLTHSVHGNEPAGFEASMQTAYQLLASDEPATLDLLKNLVVLINPSQNPDGHERFAAWYNSVSVGSDEPAAIEQTEPWSIWGRYNHYRFDMNRDMLAQSQLESRALAGAMMRWRPTVVVDLHSTTSQYFFPPVAQAINQNLPATSFRWFERFGRGNAEAFDARGWQYFVRDEFDFFYPGYIDEWPTMHGATGMTFESDGGPELRKRKDDGTYMTFEMGIAHHFVASLATLTTAAAARSERLRDYYDFHASGMAQAKNRPLKRVIFLPNPDPLRAYWLAGLLVREDIEVSRTTQPVALQRATSYLGGAAGKRTLPAGSYVVDLIQPEARLATALLEPRAVFDSTFVHDEQAKYDRNKRRGEDVEQEGYDFYDITAWTLPLAQGIEAYWTDEVVPAGVRVTPADTLPRPAPPAAARSAYLFTDETEAGARLAMQLLHEGFHVAIATRPLMADGVNYPRGTFVARVQRNPVTLHERISALATDIGVPVAAVRSAFPDSGQAGVGSESVTGLHAPRILLAGGDGIDQTAFGAIWYYLEREIRYPVVPINLASVGKMNLTDYNVLIIPSGSPSRLWRELGEDGAERLKAWVRAGGCVIVSGDAVGLLSRKEVALTTARSMGEDEDDKKETKDIAKDTVVADRGVPAPPLVSPTASGGVRPEFIPGAIFRATLDRTHWLTFGYERDQLPVFLNTGSLLKPSEKGANPVAFVGSDLTLAGFTWPNNTEKYLRGSVWAAVETVGDGHVVAFADDPLFRGFWRGTAKLVTNAILFGPGR